MPMTCLQSRLPALQEHPDRRRQRIRVRPILGPSHDQPAFRVLDDETQNLVEITEVDEDGDVPTVRVRNPLDTPVLLIDGQGLVGAKQNRILNTDVMVPAKTTLDVPVSCVEQGRWRYDQPKFRTAGSASHRVRRRKLDRMASSLREHQGHDADQGEVWAQVRASLDKTKTRSRSEALHDAYAARDRDLSAYREAFELPEQAVGAAVFVGTELQGIDLFDRHSTLAFAWRSLVDGYALEHLDDPVDPEKAEPAPEDRTVPRVLERAAAGTWQRYDSPGLGDDWRLADAAYAGAALVLDDEHLVHLQLMPKTGTDDA